MPAPFRLALAAALTLAACETPPAATDAAPALTREDAQVVTLDLTNGADAPIVALARVSEGRAGPNLLAPGQIVPPGERFALPVAPGPYLLRAQLQPPGVFQPGRVIQRHLVVPRFPPNPPPRMPLTLR